MSFKFITLLFTVVVWLTGTGVNGQNVSLCDKYTTALFGTNNATNELKLITAVVNTALIGNYTPGALKKVTGILNPGTYGGQQINLLPYFTGESMTDNVGGKPGSVNWLDGGGATPLTQNLPANNTSSRQYRLVTNLYAYFGTLLGCSGISNATDAVFPSYQGTSMMYNLHKFMNLTYNQVSYFIVQVGDSAASFGVSAADVTTVATVLNSTFNVRCSPPKAVVTSDPELQSICFIPSCPLAPNPTCSAYDTSSPSSSPAPAPPPVTPAVSPAATGGSAPTTATVRIPPGAMTMGVNAFNPSSLTIKSGSSVVWMNTDSIAHTATARSGTNSPTLFNTGNIAAGSTTPPVQFTTPGTYTYGCSYHAGMGPATITVTS